MWGLCAKGSELRLDAVIDEALDRKGMPPCMVLVWRKIAVVQ